MPDNQKNELLLGMNCNMLKVNKFIKVLKASKLKYFSPL